MFFIFLFMLFIFYLCFSFLFTKKYILIHCQSLFVAIRMDTYHNIRLVKLLMRLLETNAPSNKTSVSIGFQNEHQNRNHIHSHNEPTTKLNYKKLTKE
jgi:hypothetical protein